MQTVPGNQTLTARAQLTGPRHVDSRKKIDRVQRNAGAVAELPHERAGECVRVHRGVHESARNDVRW